MGQEMDFVTLHRADGKAFQIPREWMDERDAEKKERDIARATAEAAIRNNPMTREEVLAKFISEDDYSKTKEYCEMAKQNSQLSDKREALSKQMHELEEAYMAESKSKPKSEWTEEDEYQALIGHRPRVYTEKGKKLKEEYDKVFKEWLKVDHEWSESNDKIIQTTAKYKRQEKKWWEEHRPVIKKGDPNKEYVGFATKTRSSYDADLARGRGFIAEMSPKEYLQRISYDVFESTWSKTFSGVNTTNVLVYMQMMKNGVKMDMPSMKPGSTKQEGRHRAMAAYLLGIDKIPVYIIED